jgi:predicted metal-dependent hydrolase
METKSLSEEIKHIIRNDIPLRKKIAVQLGIEQRTVYHYAATKKRERALTRYPIVIEILKKHTGFSESKILVKNKIKTA